jgi:hypothetical protein
MSREYRLTAFQTLLWLSAGLLVPGAGSSWDSAVQLPAVLVTWLVSISTTLFTYHSGGGLAVNLLPAFSAFLAVTGFDLSMEVVYLFSTLTGYMAYSVRIGRSRRSALHHAVRKALTAWAALRCARLAAHLAGAPGPAGGLPVMLLALVVFAIVEEILRRLGTIDGEGLDRPARLLHSLLMPSVFLPLMSPALGSVSVKNPVMMVPAELLAGAGSLVAAQLALAFLLESSKWAQGRTLSLQRALVTLTWRLSSSGTRLAALQSLASVICSAFSPRTVRVRADNLEVRSPAGESLPDEQPLSRRGRSGLTVDFWPDETTVLDGSRLDSFITHTETALQNLELGSRLSSEAWSCMEAMVYSLDRADHRLSGHSRRVARLAVEMGRRMGLQRGLLNTLRMAALLHHAGSAVLGEQEAEAFEHELMAFSIPQETKSGILGMTEHFDGTGGPSGLSGGLIPVSARILAVADEYVSELERGTQAAARDAVRLRSGTLFDPGVVGTLEQVLEGPFEI